MTLFDPQMPNKWYGYDNRLSSLHNNKQTSNWSFYCKTCGWYWYMNLNSDLAMQTFFSIHFQTTSGFTIGLLWREGDQGYWGLNASSLDGIWWLKRHTDRSPNSLQWQLGLPDELRLYQEGLEMDVILKNTKLRRCESPPNPLFCHAFILEEWKAAEF